MAHDVDLSTVRQEAIVAAASTFRLMGSGGSTPPSVLSLWLGLICPHDDPALQRHGFAFDAEALAVAVRPCRADFRPVCLLAVTFDAIEDEGRGIGGFGYHVNVPFECWAATAAASVERKARLKGRGVMLAGWAPDRGSCTS